MSNEDIGISLTIADFTCQSIKKKIHKFVNEGNLDALKRARDEAILSYGMLNRVIKTYENQEVEKQEEVK